MKRQIFLKEDNSFVYSIIPTCNYQQPFNFSPSIDISEYPHLNVDKVVIKSNNFSCFTDLNACHATEFTEIKVKFMFSVGLYEMADVTVKRAV